MTGYHQFQNCRKLWTNQKGVYLSFLYLIKYHSWSKQSGAQESAIISDWFKHCETMWWIGFFILTCCIAKGSFTEGADYSHHITASNPGFENLTTSLHSALFKTMELNYRKCTWDRIDKRYICLPLSAWRGGMQGKSSRDLHNQKLSIWSKLIPSCFNMRWNSSDGGSFVWNLRSCLCEIIPFN